MADVDEMNLESQAFESIQKEFQEVLNELATDQSLERFRQEFDKLHRSLKISHENQRRLISKCRELNAEIAQNAAKVQTVLKMTSDDSTAIQYLKTELEKTYKILELSREREEKSKQKIENLHAEIRQLNNAIEQGNSMTSGQTSTVHELIISKQELLKERDMLQAMISTVKSEITSVCDRIKNIETNKDKSEVEYKLLIKQKQDLEERVQRDEENKKKVQEELETIKRQYDTSKADQEKVGTDKRRFKHEIDKLKLQIHEKDVEREELMKRLNKNAKEQNELKQRINSQLYHNDQTEIFLREQDAKLSKLEKEFQFIEKRCISLTHQGDSLKKEVEELELEKVESEKLKELSVNGINQLETEIIHEKRSAFDDRQLIEDMRRARDILQKDLDRADNNNKRLEEEKIQKQKYQKEKQNELSGLSKEMERLNRKIQQLDKEKEKYGLQFAQAQAKYFHSLEEIKLKDNLISEFQKKNIETEAKLKQQQNLYEAVRSDRNLYSKNLTETQEEIAEIRRRYKIVNHQISQLKEEIDLKETALTKEHFEHKKKDKTIEEQARVLEKYKGDIDEKEKKIKTYMGEISKLHFIIKESEQQRQKLKEEYELVVAERDILGTQLIRRNAETGLLYEKIKINQSTLNKGESQYRERLGDIDMLKTKIADLIREIKVFKKEAGTITDLSSDIHNLSKELIEEKLKVKSLTEELENPMNVHRWRKLEATDSETYELMTKIQSLQKRLIQKTEEVVYKEKLVEEKEKDLKALRDEMKRRPGLEEERMIPVYEENLSQKEKQMNAMEQELKMYQSHLSEQKLEIERLNKVKKTSSFISQQVQEIKKKYFQQKKREQQQRDLRQQPGQQVQVVLPEKKFVGGGFALQI